MQGCFIRTVAPLFTFLAVLSSGKTEKQSGTGINQRSKSVETRPIKPEVSCTVIGTSPCLVSLIPYLTAATLSTFNLDKLQSVVRQSPYNPNHAMKHLQRRKSLGS